jgi:hypothetical protein
MRYRRRRMSVQGGTSMKPVARLCLGSLMLIAAPSFAGEGAVVCGAVHFIRAAGTEFRNSLINLRNLDLENPATVERITIRNAFGDVVHDSGPATSQPHPLNTDFAGGLNITTVPPGASYYLGTNHIWPLGEIPGVGMAETGQNLAVTVQFSKDGKADLFQVSAVSRTRERFGTGAERARDGSSCTEVKARD